MVEYTVLYTMDSKYEKSVRKAFFQILVLPINDKDQQVSDVKNDCSLIESEHFTTNMFGFSLIQYSSQIPICSFNFNFRARVMLKEKNPYDFISVAAEEEYMLLMSDNFYLKYVLYLMHTPLTLLPFPKAEGFFKFEKNYGVFNYLKELNERIHNYIEYTPDVTNTKTSASEVLELKRGVCQDYTHLFLAVCRANRIPARYVSGYLNPGEELIGTSQTHAWVEAMVPKVGWIGFDPTNNLLVDHHYIKISHGTDYRDCSPVSGVLETSGGQQNSHVVTVINQ